MLNKLITFIYLSEITCLDKNNHSKLFKASWK